MKIKRQLMWSLIGEIDPNILFGRIKKLYPNTKYFNPLDPHYNGISMNDFTALNGVKIENLLSGPVMTIKGKDVSDKKIHVSMNAEIYHMGMLYIEEIYTLDDWCDELDKFDGIIIKNDKDKSLVSPNGSTLKFFITDLMCVEEIATLDDEHYNYGSIDKREVDKIIHDKYGFIMNRLGTSIGPDSLSTSRSPNIALDEDGKISINPDNDNKVSQKFDIYEIEDKNIYLTKDSDTFDKASRETKKDFIEANFLLFQHKIAASWLAEIKAKSTSILESIDNANEVYWQNLRREIEMWQLSFLTFHSKFYINLSKFGLFLSGDGVFSKEQCKEWDEERKEEKEEAALLYNEVKYGLDNLATPGHTHDEQLLQHETEKVNERILLLSFLAMSIPMIGAILTPALSLNLKLISGCVVLSLPLLYIATRKITFRRNKNLNAKDYLKSEAKQLKSKLDQVEDRIKAIENHEDLPDDLKKTYLVFVDKSYKGQTKKLDKMNKKIKSL